jgi:hypothetical protein
MVRIAFFTHFGFVFPTFTKSHHEDWQHPAPVEEDDVLVLTKDNFDETVNNAGNFRMRDSFTWPSRRFNPCGVLCTLVWTLQEVSFYRLTEEQLNCNGSLISSYRLAPEYAVAAKELKTFDPPVPLAKVDATVETDLANKYSICYFLYSLEW